MLLPEKIWKSWSPQITVYIAIFLFFFTHSSFILLTYFTPACEDLNVLVIFHVSAVLMWYSYYKVSVTDPGYVSESWENKIKEEGRTSEFRKCDKCNRLKPERTHHCSKCNRCVLRMDHHCPWSNTCSGFNNHKYFLLVIVWGMFCMSIAAVCTLQLIMMPDYFSLFYVFLLLFYLYLIFNFCLMIFMHGSLVLFNYTTIEFAEKKRASEFVNVYNLGTLENIKQVFGKDAYAWLLPVRWGKLGDGHSFPKNSLSPAKKETTEETSIKL